MTHSDFRREQRSQAGLYSLHVSRIVGDGDVSLSPLLRAAFEFILVDLVHLQTLAACSTVMHDTGQGNMCMQILPIDDADN
ncbi:hypothetical protein U9M48_030456 [Paspalum notatum var. saurae]|uniref:Uncharacterized protein n=1 Tax=Paspalum notatum var. saurae TaxID=547442 RepID=A0AAQ3U0A5_PASNO